MWCWSATEAKEQPDLWILFPTDGWGAALYDVMYQKKAIFICFLRQEFLSLSRHSEGLGEKDKGLWEGCGAAATEGGG